MSLPDLLQEALARAGLSEVELSVRNVVRGVARFSRAELDQSASYDERFCRARVAHHGRVGAATTTDLSLEGLAAAIVEADAAARASPEVPGFPGFAPADATRAAPSRPVRATEAAGPAERARRVVPLLERAREEGLDAAGVLETRRVEAAVATTAGARQHGVGTQASARVFVSGPDSSGFAGVLHRDLDAIDVAALGEDAIDRCRRSASPIELPAGSYDVVLEPEAVGELLSWFALASLGAREVADGSSALAGRAGEPITGSWVRIRDDVHTDDEHALGVGLGFDAEGTTKTPLDLIESGCVRGPAFDRLWAARAGRTSTGHAAPLGWDEGPLPLHLRLDGGGHRPEELVAALDRGIHVTRFHYVNGLLDPRRALMTGMTRDGTFLVEKGRATKGVRNLRFTESLLEALGRADGVSRVCRAITTPWGDDSVFVVPTLLIRGFRFTGEVAA